MKYSLIAASVLGLFSTVTMANVQNSNLDQTVAKQQYVNAQTQASTVKTAQASAFASTDDKLSYTIGVDLAKNFEKQGFSINPQIMSQAIQDVNKKENLKMTKAEMDLTLKNFRKDLLAKRADQFKDIANKNKKTGEDFLVKNKNQPGVVVLPNGLQYKIITPGNGQKPAASDVVTVEYSGKLINGTVFDSTEQSGKPLKIKVSEVIKGWSEALQLMKQGATWEVFVPADLAYGERGIGGPIGPNETLIFNIRLIAVDKTEAVANSNVNQPS